MGRSAAPAAGGVCAKQTKNKPEMWLETAWWEFRGAQTKILPSLK
jgi:hypothetical protein